MTRKEAREQAFVLLFQNTFKNESLEELLEVEKENGAYCDDEYCARVVKTALDNIELLNETISKYAKGWSIQRISRVAVSALRLALAEIMFLDDIPEAASVNEAVELVKTYATQDDAAFVNGILGSYLREKD